MNKRMPDTIHMAVVPKNVLKKVPSKAPIMKESIMEAKLLNFIISSGL